jgi:protocatechuate 3,4-dioxygenase beta subunit
MRGRHHPTYEGRRLANPHEDIFDQGLGFDLETVMGRRGMLRILGLGAGAVVLAGCGTTPSSSSSTSDAASDAASCASEIPEETAGPYPGDGSNGPDVLSQSGIVRRDITSSFGDATGTADGVPLTITFNVTDVDNGCAPYAGAAVYVWHCDREGRYSLYSPGAENENYLRGVQEAGDDGVVTFDSIFPACYSGRWPHIHFEVYPSLADATDVANTVSTSQIALPEDSCNEVYATSGYEQSVTNMAPVSLDGDNVFGEDGGVDQLGTVEGSIDGGLTVVLGVPVSGR